jgi:hypothetical protein
MELSIVKEDRAETDESSDPHLSDGAARRIVPRRAATLPGEAPAIPGPAQPPADMRPTDVRVGSKDQAGRDIVDVLWATRDYAIYRWHKDTHEQAFLGNGERIHRSYGISPLFGNPTQQKRFALIGPALARLSALQKGALASRNSINCEVARAISLAIEGHPREARRTLAELQERLRAIRNTEDRAYYVTFLGLAALLFVALMLAAYIPGAADTTRPLWQMLHVTGFGALGGFFSVLTKINRLHVDPEASRRIIAISASTRILLAVVGAVAVYTFLLSTVGQAVLNAQRMQEMATACTFAFLAGFSEHFVPGLFRALEQRGEPAAGGGGVAAEPRSGRTRRVREL